MSNLSNLAFLQKTNFNIPNINHLYYGPNSIYNSYLSTILSTNNTSSNIINNTASNTINNIPKYYLVPGQDYQYNYYYQNVNKDPRLRKQITEFYTDELLEWVKYDSSLSYLKSLVSKNSYKKNRANVYKVLRKFVNHNNVNWYDLKNYYSHLKREIIKSLTV